MPPAAIVVQLQVSSPIHSTGLMQHRSRRLNTKRGDATIEHRKGKERHTGKALASVMPQIGAKAWEARLRAASKCLKVKMGHHRGKMAEE